MVLKICDGVWLVWGGLLCCLGLMVGLVALSYNRVSCLVV